MGPIDRVAELRRQIEYEKSEIDGCKDFPCQDCVDARRGLLLARHELQFLIAVKDARVGVLQHPEDINAAREWYFSTQVK